TALLFSVVTDTPRSLASVEAFSACFTVAVTRFGEKSSCFRYARIRIPPSFPVPNTASFLSDSLCAVVLAIVQAFLTRISNRSTQECSSQRMAAYVVLLLFRCFATAQWIQPRPQRRDRRPGRAS